jgi:hypothetical protein
MIPPLKQNRGISRVDQAPSQFFEHQSSSTQGGGGISPAGSVLISKRYGLDPIDKKPPSCSHNAGKTPRVDVIYKRGGAQEEVADDTRYTAKEDDYSIPWEAKLRQYFKFCIETDDSVC